MNYPLDGDFLLVRGTRSFLLAGHANARFALCIETAEQEYCQTLDPSDLVAASAPEGGPLEPAIMLIEFVRKYRIPLTVLPRNHPGSKRFAYLVSAGPEIHTSCDIRRGTHPEQHLICSSDELAGLVLRGVPGGVEIHHLPQHATVSRVNYELSTKIL
ncbi:MAG: alpha/beta hydrolase [Methanomicrobiales archaeon]|nr:alpha/beta hydrolase [Methanomicrobiales archaeon]